MTSYFQNAQQFTFQGTIINADNYIQHGSVKGPLESLANHITAGALHNSEERCDAPKCHAETRVAVQQEIISWIVGGENDDLPKKVLWMSGPAGTGKTAIAGSVAEICKEKGLLAATFFFSSFSRSRDRSSKRWLITTIAYQLLRHGCLEEVGKRILAAIERNPVIFEMCLRDQLEELILTPLREVQAHCADIAHWPKVIILDGLDEVEPDQQDGSASGAQQAREQIHWEILSVLMHAALDPAFPFRILVVSRPERVIRGFFTGEDFRKLTREVFLDEKYHPDADIELFLKSKFAEIQRRYNLSSPWPAEDAIRNLVKNASGQFIYASTVIRFVSDNKNLPQTQLDRVLQLGTPAADESNPFAALDALYTRILDSSPNPRLVVKWLKTIDRSRESPALFWKQLLESAPGEEEYLFSNLTSLISIPPPHDSISPYILYHKSQWDFLRRIPAFHHLDVEWPAKDSIEEFVVLRLVHAVKYKGPLSLKNEAERDAFAAHLISTGLLRGEIFPLRSPNDSWFTQPTFSTWATHPSSEYDVLTCDVAWWIERILSEYHPQRTIEYYTAPGGRGPWPQTSEDLARLFWDVHCQNAQNFTFEGTIVSAGNYYVQNGPVKDPRERLHDNITSGAMHNSAERCDAPKCHAKTRIAVQEEILVWITHGENDDLPKVLWLSGPAGTGKTAIAGSIAGICKAKGLLAATFFFSSFSGSRERCSKRWLITTIAYQLLQHDSLQEVGRLMLLAIDKNPAIFQLRLKDQLEELILVPLREVRGQGLDPTSWPKVIILDGLDEVEPDVGEGLGPSGARRSKDEVHLEILSVLLDAVNDPAFPFHILVVSRPEKVIRGFLAGEDTRGLTRQIFLDEKYDPDADITLFLKSKFAVIRDEYSLPSTWPTEDDIQLLVRNASGQFIYADTVVRYVSDRTSLPQIQLDRVLKLGTTNGEANPFATLDALYTRIFNSSPDPRLAVKWLRIISLGGLHYPASFWRRFLELEEGEGAYLMSNLSSLISIPPPHNPVTRYIVYHKSLLDFFLRIPKGSTLYVPRVGADSHDAFYTSRFVRVLNNRGPATSRPTSEAERNIFLRRFTHSCFLFTIPWYLISPKSRSLEHTVLSDDAVWLIDLALSCYNPPRITIGGDPQSGWSTWSQVLAQYFWEVHRDCPCYRCLPICHLWRTAIIQACRERGWAVPGQLALFYNRFVRSTLVINAETGEKHYARYPSGMHFNPPPVTKEVTVAKPRETTHPRGPQQHHRKHGHKDNDKYYDFERSNLKASMAVFPLS